MCCVLASTQGTRHTQPLCLPAVECVPLLLSAELQCNAPGKGNGSRESAKLGLVTEEMIPHKAVTALTTKMQNKMLRCMEPEKEVSQSQQGQQHVCEHYGHLTPQLVFL